MTTSKTESSIGTPLSSTATRALLLGSGELGKEVAIELQRLGIEVVAVDRYENAPAMQVAHRSHVIDMQDEKQLMQVLEKEQPDLIIPEIEAINTEVLLQLEETQPWTVRIVPTARATSLTMNREGIRRLAAEELGLPTSAYRFVSSEAELAQAAAAVGFPCVVKPIMSSSGKGQSVVKDAEDVRRAWQYAQTGSRSAQGSVQPCIVEAFVDFDDEITLLTVRHCGGTEFLDPIHHRQVDGDYAESWQDPAGHSTLSEATLAEARTVAKAITDGLGGWGLFGVELFIKDGNVIFSEVSPRPHDTGLVTLVSGDLSEFAQHARAVLGFPVNRVTRFPGAAASHPIKVFGNGVPVFLGIEDALKVDPSIQVRLFGKPSVDGERRVAVVLARAETTATARALASSAAEKIKVEFR